jgi:RNA polymerase primary sigma factor
LETGLIKSDHSSANAGADETTDNRPAERRSALSIYIQEISRMSLLTPLEEIELAARIKQGDEEARQKLIQSNLRLVVKIARDYEHVGLPLLDLINEGNIGLMKGVDHFDPSKGAKFSTYGAFWIKQAIKRALSNQSKTIRLPCHMVDKIYHMRIAAHRFQELFSRVPTDQELAEEMGLSAGQITRMRRASQRPVSLDAPLGDKDTNTLSDVVADDQAQPVLDRMQREAGIDAISKLVDELPEREAGILRRRFGLDGGIRMTLEQIGEHFMLTRERIRQLQNSALRRLKLMIEGLDAANAAIA